MSETDAFFRLSEAFSRLSDVLSQMQTELAWRNWEGDGRDRIQRAADMRLKMFDAVCDYRDRWIDIVKGRL